MLNLNLITSPLKINFDVLNKVDTCELRSEEEGIGNVCWFSIDSSGNVESDFVCLICLMLDIDKYASNDEIENQFFEEISEYSVVENTNLSQEREHFLKLYSHVDQLKVYKNGNLTNSRLNLPTHEATVIKDVLIESSGSYLSFFVIDEKCFLFSWEDVA